MKKTFTILIAALAAILMMAQPVKVMGQTKASISITQSSAGISGSSYSSSNFTLSGVKFGYNEWMKNNSLIQAKKSITNSCYNDDPIPGKITSVVVVQSTSGTNTSTPRAIKVYGGTSKKPTSEISAPTTAGEMTFDFSNYNYNYFSIKTPGNACYFVSITVYYTPSHTISYSATHGSIEGVVYGTSTAVEDGDAVLEGGKVTLTAQPDDGYQFDGWDVSGTGSTIVSTGSNTATFTMGTADATVTANFVSAGNYITISPTTKNVDAEGGAQEFTIDTDQTISTTTNAAVQFYSNVAGTAQYEADKPSWITSTAYSTVTNKLTVTVAANHTAAANGPVYFRVKNSDGSVTSDVVTISQAAFSVATPEFDVDAGTYYEDQLVGISCDTPDATIYYTTNGTTPTANNGTEYDGNGVEITANTTLKAIAIKYNVSSEVATATYTFPAITIASARALDDDATCTIVGVVSYVDTKNIYIQDATAAIVVYNKDASYSSTYSKGDKLAVSGTKTTFYGLIELKNPTINQKLSSGNTVTPVVKTIAQINDNATNGNNSWQAMLVTIERATYDYTNNKVIQGNNELAVYGTMGSATNGDMVTFTGNIGNHDQVQMVNMTDVHVIVDPVILAASSIAAPNYIVGATSSAITYEVLTVNGTNLTDDILVTLEDEDQSDFEISDDLDTWGYSITLDKGEGTVEDAEIAVRLKAGKTVADYSDRIVLSSTDATTVYVTVSGSVTYANVTYSGNAEGVTNVPEDTKDYVYNEEVTVLGKGTMARTGYNFGWWDTQADGKGTPYDPEDEDNNKFNITANTTLYAIWEVQTYNYELNVTGDDDDAVAELEVDGNPVAANAKIAYGKEVTVNVVVTDGYIYSISVNNGAVTVTNDKFTMPAGDVTVTVTTEANPYIKAKLLSADILNMTTDTQNDYGYSTIKTKEITSNDTLYVWQTNGYQHTNNNVVDLGMIQLRVRTNVTKGVGYIKLPDFAGKIENIKFDVSGNGNSDTSPTSSKTSTKLYFQEAPTSDGTIIAEGGGSATNTITISLADKCYSTGYIVANGGLRVWNIVVTYRPYQNMTGTELTTIASDQTISIPASTNATATNLTIPASSGIIIKSGASLTVSGTLSVGEGGTANNIVIEDGGKLVTHNAVQATVKKNVTAAAIWGTTGDSYTPDGWYFIASPVNNASFSTAITSGDDNDYDLFMLDWTNNKWRNKKDTDNNTLFAGGFQRGTGYLYASQAGNTLSVAGEIQPLDNEDKATVELANDGWNLIGNPLTCKVTVSCEFGSLNNGSTVDYTANTVNPFQGIAVYGNAGTTVTFTKATTQNAADPSNNISLQMTLAKKVTSRGETSSKVVDNAVVSFSESKGLPKFNMLGGNVKLYIPQNDEEYAVAFSNKHGDVPLNFKAKELGTYTISFEGEEMDLNGIYLIDMLDEVEIDLNTEPSYTFIGSPADRSARFKIVFKNNGNDSTSDIFAYQSGSDIVVSGEGELQIFDVMGRMVARHNVNGVQTINAMAHGVYIFKLNEKTQKIIVK